MVRPREFDRDIALRKAMQLFWTKGYEGTSLTDLTETMSISRSSLYETFGDKQTLFLEALNHYFEFTDNYKTALLTNPLPVKQKISHFLATVIDFLLNEDLPDGCFFTNTATALGTLDAQIQAAIRTGLEKQEEFFYLLLEQGKQSGEFIPDQEIRGLARFLVGLVRGITVVAKVTKDRKILEDIVNVGLKAIV